MGQLLFIYDSVLQASSESGLLHSPNGFAAPRDFADIEISTSQTKILHFYTAQYGMFSCFPGMVS